MRGRERAMARVRVAIGGINHETNTFNTVRTGLDAFRVTRGSGLLADEAARSLLADGVDVVPTIYAEALPSGPVGK
ncbi:TPA: hypothetical protein EYP44_05265, partial [Candidatus Bathyarchaeota archaeon]|nr:hypothetical protein [Candidatus Bathyarchaeota archaeon]